MEQIETKRTIEEVLDLEHGELISTKDFFKLPENELIAYRRKQQEAIIGLIPPKFLCPYCLQIVKISGKSTQRGIVSFFAHTYDSDECPIKTNSTFSKEDLDAIKYSKIRESQRHLKLKDLLSKALSSENSKKIGVRNVAVEKTFKSDNPLLNWRRPDVYAEFNGYKIAFEIQLSTTFLSVIVARDIFYKMNNTYIIWIFNFSQHQEYINLENLMCKDIYYANKRNAFIFDNEAIARSNESKELILKVIWFEPMIENGTVLSGKTIRKQEFVSLSNLKFEDDKFKPYYINADLLYQKINPSHKIDKESDTIHLDWFNKIEENVKKVFEEKELQRQEAKINHEAKINAIKDGIKNGEYKLSPIKKSGKWGFESQGEIIIEPAYTKVEPFDESGYSKIYIDRRYGYINTEGKILVSPIYKELTEVIENFCFGKKNDEWYIIDINNHIPKSLDAQEIDQINNSPLMFRTKKIKIKSIRKPKSNWYEKTKYSQVSEFYFGIINHKGNIVIPPIYSEISSFHQNIARAEINNFVGKLSLKDDGSIDSFIYNTGEFNEFGLATSQKNGLWGMIDRNNEVILDFIHSSISKFEDGIAMVECKTEYGPLQGSYFGYISSMGKYIIPPQYQKQSIIRLDNGGFKVKVDGYWGCFSSDGQVVIPAEYSLLSDFFNHKAFVKKESLCGIIDEKGNVLLPIKYQQIFSRGECQLKVQSRELWGIIDYSDNCILPIEFQEFIEYDKHLIKVKKNDLWGFLDERFQVVIPIEYSEIILMSGEVSSQRIDNRWSPYTVTEPVLNHSQNRFHFSLDEEMLKVKKNNLWGIISFDQKEILPLIYDEIEEFRNDFAKIKLNGKWGFINKKGIIVVKPIYDELQYFYYGTTTIKIQGNKHLINNLARYIKSGKRGYVDSNGREYWQYWKESRDFYI